MMWDVIYSPNVDLLGHLQRVFPAQTANIVENAKFELWGVDLYPTFT